MSKKVVKTLDQVLAEVERINAFLNVVFSRQKLDDATTEKLEYTVGQFYSKIVIKQIDSDNMTHLAHLNHIYDVIIDKEEDDKYLAVKVYFKIEPEK